MQTRLWAHIDIW